MTWWILIVILSFGLGVAAGFVLACLTFRRALRDRGWRVTDTTTNDEVPTIWE